MIRFLSNQAGAGHAARLARQIKRSREAFIAVAFLKNKGLTSLLSPLQALLKRGGELTVIAGTDFWLTDPVALRALFKLQGRYPKCSLHIFARDPRSTFHPKYYRFSTAQGIEVVIGSANLTGGGLAGNVELSALEKGPGVGELQQQAAEFERALLKNSRCRLSDPALLGRYESECAVQEEWRKKAEREATKKMREITPLDNQELQGYLAEYRANIEQQAEYALRTANYHEAGRVLRQDLAVARNLSRSEFKGHFERLVGTKGVKLWHSGSLYRKKNFIFPQHAAMQAMIREIKGNLSLPAAALFELGLRWIAQIEHLGPNIFTEICNTLRPARFAVLNKNPVTSLRELGLGAFPAPGQFKPEDYERFCEALEGLRRRCGFTDLGQTDHFLNYVYWKTRERGFPARMVRHQGDSQGAEGRELRRATGRGITAVGYQTTTGFLVKAGSQAAGTPVPSMRLQMPGFYRLREQMIARGALRREGTHYIYPEAYEFKTPSAAIAVTLGRSGTGLKEWMPVEANRGK